MSDYSNEKKILGSFLIGGIIGAGIALLFAPQSGRKTRKDISKFTRNVANDARDMIDDAAESIQDLSGVVTEKLSDMASSGKGIAEDSRKKIVKSLDNLQKVIEKQKERLV